MRKILLFYLFLLFIVSFVEAQTGPLETGQILKIGITKTGVYKIDANLLQKNGLDISKVNIKNIHIYGNSAGMLPQSNAIKRPTGLIENSIQIYGEVDGVFNPSDYILFFGQAPHEILYNVEKQSIKHQLNIYSDTTFYFLVINDLPGKRIISNENLEVNAPYKITTFDDYFFHEAELKQINGNTNDTGKSGRYWLGEELSENTSLNKTFDLEISDIVANSNAKINVGVIGSTLFDKSRFQVTINNNLIQEIQTEAVFGGDYGARGAYNFDSKDFKIESSTNPKIELSIKDSPGNYTLGYLDHIGLQVKRNLNYSGKAFQFQSFESSKYNYVKYLLKTIDNQAFVWDVTDPLNPENCKLTLQDGLVFNSNTNYSLKNYFVFTDKNYLNIESVRKINIQNLHHFNAPNLLIVTTEKYRQAAQKLADHRALNDKLSAEVVLAEEIYNEFSSGKVDVTAIRDFAKLLFNQPNSKLKYLLIFADASFDVRNKDNDATLKKILPDLIPAYQSFESLDNVKSFSSEDYFGFLEDNEGDWLETTNNADNHTLDIGVGRIPVKTVAEAEGVVEKLIFYDSKLNTIGAWRTKIALASDDGDANLHQFDSEDLAKIVKQKGNNYRPEKIYVDAFPKLSGNENGKLSPQTSKKITDSFKKGALIFNYIGHGGIQNLSDEKILTREDIANWQNLENMPLMVTATCQFGRYDNYGEISGAEKAVLNPNGGAIALLTTTRPVYSITNKRINEAFYNAVFEHANGKFSRLGDILKATKNNSFETVYNRNFTLLGDPSMQLAYPEQKIVLNQLNNLPFSIKGDTLRALQKVVIEGEIQDYFANTISSNFNGNITIKVFDKETKLRTLGNNTNRPMDYGVFDDKIFEGEYNVKGGKFNFDFTIPKDINYQFGEGRIEMYAFNNDKSLDAAGSYNKLIIGGNNNGAKTDLLPPDILSYLSKTEFKNGDTVGKNPILFSTFKDDSGININKAAVGHQITAILDGKTTHVLNDYIKPVFGNKNEYNLQYQFLNLTEGKHTLEITVWDIYNNFATSTLDFIVKWTNDTILNNVYNFPNPIIDFSKIAIDHNFINENVTATVNIFNSGGALLTKQKFYFIEAESPLTIKITSESIFKSNYTKGVFPYSIELKSEKTNKTAHGASKLIVLD